MADNHASLPPQPRMSRAFAAVETTFGTQVKPTGANAFRFLTGGPKEAKPQRDDVDEHRDSRSREERFTGRTPPVAWEYECLLRPLNGPGSGGNGPPDIHPFLLAGISSDTAANGGGYTQGAAAETYALADIQGVGLSLYKMIPPPVTGLLAMKLGRYMRGAFVDETEIKFSGSTAPTIRFSGVGANSAFCVPTTATGAAVGSDIGVTDPASIPVGSIVGIYEAADGTTVLPDPGGERTGDNNGAGFLVTANDGTDITLDAAPPSNAEAGDFIKPWAPVETGLVGQPIPPYIGSLTVGGVVVVPIEGSLLIKNNRIPHDNEAFEQYMTSRHDNWRDVTFNCKYRAKTSALLEILARREDFGNLTVTLVIGQTSLGICTVTFKGEMGFEDTDEPKDDIAQPTMSFRGTASSTGAKDEVSIAFT